MLHSAAATKNGESESIMVVGGIVNWYRRKDAFIRKNKEKEGSLRLPNTKGLVERAEIHTGGHHVFIQL